MRFCGWHKIVKGDFLFFFLFFLGSTLQNLKNFRKSLKKFFMKSSQKEQNFQKIFSKKRPILRTHGKASKDFKKISKNF